MCKTGERRRIYRPPYSSGVEKEGLDYEEYTKRLRLRISAPAADGRANKAVNDYFSRLFGSSNLVYGYTSRKKRF